MQLTTHKDKVFRQLWIVTLVVALIALMGCEGDPDDQANCDTYCSESLATCSGNNAQFANTAECMDACRMFSTRGEDGDKKGDTLQCRLYHLSVADTDPMLHCPHSGPDGANQCVDDVSQCDRYCGLIDETCSEVAPQYESLTACNMECEANFRQESAVMGNTVQCRQEILLSEDQSMTLGQKCKEAGKVGDSTICVDEPADE